MTSDVETSFPSDIAVAISDSVLRAAGALSTTEAILSSTYFLLARCTSAVAVVPTLTFPAKDASPFVPRTILSVAIVTSPEMLPPALSYLSASAAILALVSAVRAAPVVGSDSNVSSLPDSAESAEARVVASAVRAV